MSEPPAEKGSQAEHTGTTPSERLVYVMPDQAFATMGDDGISLRELWEILWRSKWVIATVTLLFATGSVTYALLATEWYRADALLAPSDAKTTTPMMGQLSGLAALAGVSVGGEGSAEALAVLESREFLGAFIEAHAVLPILFEEKWDKERGVWLLESDEETPDIRDAVEHFKKNILKVHQNRETQLVTIAVEWTDPDVAAEWVTILVRRLNERLRERALNDAEMNVTYLQSELAKTSLVTLQQSIGRLLEHEMQKLMLARGNEEFAFKIVDPAEAPKRRIRPNRALTSILGTVLGGIVGVILALGIHVGRSVLRQRRANPLAHYESTS